MNNLKTLLNEYLEKESKRTPGEWKPYASIHGEIDRIGYGEELSWRHKGKFEYFPLCEFDSDNFEQDAKFSAHAANTYKPIVSALLVAVESLEYCSEGDCGTLSLCRNCEAHKQIETLLGVGKND